MSGQEAGTDRRTAEQIREHYEIEKELAGRLRSASKEERRALYTAVYNELFRRVPHHTQLARKASPEETARDIAADLRFLGRFLAPEGVFLEIGAGDCAVSFEIAKSVRRVYAVDVSHEITRGLAPPPNFELVISDGSSIPLPPGSVRVAYSNQLMEHLHPDDAALQLRNIYDALAPGGVYACVTPNRLGGPHDISRNFDRVATGFHLKEYTIGELRALFRRAGFGRVRAFVGSKGTYAGLPPSPLVALETILALLPHGLRKRAAYVLPFRKLMVIRLVGWK
jgi:SAM-dependent methyltransferase